MYIINATLFLSSVTGVVVNKSNIILIIMALELMLLSVNLNFIVSSLYVGDSVGTVLIIFVLTLAAAESSLILSLLSSYNEIKRTDGTL